MRPHAQFVFSHKINEQSHAHIWVFRTLSSKIDKVPRNGKSFLIFVKLVKSSILPTRLEDMEAEEE